MTCPMLAGSGRPFRVGRGPAQLQALVHPEDARDVRMAAPILVAWVASARWPVDRGSSDAEEFGEFGLGVVP